MAFDSILYILLSDSNKNIVITFGHEISHLVSFELRESVVDLLFVLITKCVLLLSTIRASWFDGFDADAHPFPFYKRATRNVSSSTQY